MLFPADFAFLIAMGLFAAFASLDAARSIASLEPHAEITIILPIVYMVSDALEDSLLALLLLSRRPVTYRYIQICELLTRTKIVTAGLALLQTLVLSSAAAIVAH